MLTNDSTKNIYNGIVDSIYSCLVKDKSHELQGIFSHAEHLNIPFLKDVNVDKFFGLLLKTNSETIYALHAGIYARYSDTDIRMGRVSIIESEREFFTKLQYLVSKKIKETDVRKISIVPFIDLDRNLQRFN